MIYYNYYYLMMLLIMIMIFMFSENFLMFLVSLEFMLMYYLMMSLVNISMFNNCLFLYLMGMGVCESVIGLSLMVSLTHIYGTQNMKVLNLMW